VAGAGFALTPRAHDVILGDGEDEVAVGVVFDLGERTLVPGEKNRPHLEMDGGGLGGWVRCGGEAAALNFGICRYRRLEVEVG